MQSEKENNAVPDSQNPTDNYPTNNQKNPADNYPTGSRQSRDEMQDSSRYSHPDARPRQDGPGGENGQE